MGSSARVSSPLSRRTTRDSGGRHDNARSRCGSRQRAHANEARLERPVDGSFDPRAAGRVFRRSGPDRQQHPTSADRGGRSTRGGTGTDAGRDGVEIGDARLNTHPGSGRGGVGGGLRGGRGADRAADGRGATSLDASSRDASFRGRDGGRRGGDGEGGHAHAGCSTSVRRSEATDSRVSAGASGTEQRPRASTPDCRMSISAVYLRF